MALNLVQGKQIATASWAVNAISSSYAVTASYLSGYVSPFPYTGSAIITGSLIVTGSVTATQGITGSLFGTSSWAVTSSFAISSSRAVTSSFAVSSSYALSSSFAVSSSRAVTSSYALSSSQAQNAVSSSYAATASYSTTLGANITQLAGSDSVALINSDSTPINIVYINNVSQSQTATNIVNFSAATVDQINIGETNVGTYAYIIRAQELEQSKHTTINIYNNLNFT